MAVVHSCSEQKSVSPQGVTSTFFEQVKKFAPTLLFVTVFLIAWVLRFAGQNKSLLETAVLFASVVSTLFILHQKLPLQNIAGLILTLAVFWWATLPLAKWSGLFLVPPRFHFQFVREHTYGLLWAAGLINARAIAKLLLFPWRGKTHHGFHVIGLAGFLMTIEDSAARANFGLFAAKFLFAAFFFIATTPWFLDKKRVAETANFQPLLLVLLLLLW